MSSICQECGCRFHSTDQSLSEQKFGQCPFCGSENIVERCDWCGQALCKGDFGYYCGNVACIHYNKGKEMPARSD